MAELEVGIEYVAVYPVGDVQSSVCAKGKEVMGSDCLCLSSPLQHEELGQDGDGLEEDGEGPEDLGEVEVVVEDEAEDDAGAQQVFDAERVNGRVVCWPAFVLNSKEEGTGGPTGSGSA